LAGSGGCPSGLISLKYACHEILQPPFVCEGMFWRGRNLLDEPEDHSFRALAAPWCEPVNDVVSTRDTGSTVSSLYTAGRSQLHSHAAALYQLASYARFRTTEAEPCTARGTSWASFRQKRPLLLYPP